MDPISQTRTELSAEPFEFSDWLEMAAESSGLSEQALLEELISSYETLNEVGKLLHHGRREGNSRQSSQQEQKSPTHQHGLTAERPFTADQSTLSAFEDRLSHLEQSVAGAGGEAVVDLEDRIDTEFVNLRRILEQLISITKANEAAIADLQSQLDAQQTG